MCTNFLCDALANLVPDIIVGIIFGLILAFWIGKQIAKFEQTEERKIEIREKIEKSIHYLKLIKEEIENNLVTLPDLIETFNTKSEISQKSELLIITPFWDSIKPSGELPRLLNPLLLSKITEFYEYADFVKRVMSRFFPNSRSNVFGWSTFVSSALEGLRNAQTVGRLIPNSIDQEIVQLNKELDAL